MKANDITLKASSSEPILTEAISLESVASSADSIGSVKLPLSPLRRKKSNLAKEKSNSGGSLSIPPPRGGGFGFKKSAL